MLEPGGLEEEEEEEERLKMAIRAEAAAEEEGGLREKEEVAEAEEEGSKMVRRSQRHEGQWPVKCSLGWQSQEAEGQLGWGAAAETHVLGH